MPGYRIFLTSQAISMLGNGLAGLAVPLTRGIGTLVIMTSVVEYVLAGLLLVFIVVVLLVLRRADRRR